MPPQLEKNHVVPTAWQDEALARDGVSREAPCSALMPSVSSMTFEGLNELTVAYLLSLILAILAVCSNLELAPPGVSPRPKQMIHSHLSVP